MLIKSLEDFELFKELPIQPICYVYYKGSPSLNTHYVGFTTQHGYKYLKRHHKMKRIEDVLNQGYSIHIYTKYNENYLINLLRPSLNKIAGIGICGRGLWIKYKLTLGELFRTTENVYLYKKQLAKTSMEKYNDSFMKTPETNNYIIQIPMDIVFNILEKEKQKYEQSNDISQTFYQNESIILLMRTKYRTVDPLFTRLFHILRYCKIHCLYVSYQIIHEIYLENLLHHVELYPLWNERFKQSDNYQTIHIEIVSRLKENHCLTNSILDYRNKSFEFNRGPSYYYRQALFKVINE
jgi:hypothetical protein